MQCAVINVDFIWIDTEWLAGNDKALGTGNNWGQRASHPDTQSRHSTNKELYNIYKLANSQNLHKVKTYVLLIHSS